MEYMLFSVLFIVLVAGIYSCCAQSEEDTEKKKGQHRPRVHSDETPSGTV